MAEVKAMINDFHMGEISRLYEAKIASEEYQGGVRSATNMRPDPRGALIGRNGFENVRSISVTAGNGCTIYGVTFDADNRFTIKLYATKVIVHDQDDNKILDTSTSYSESDLHGANSDQHLAHLFLHPDGTKVIVLVDGHAPAQIDFTAGSPWTAALSDITFTNKPSTWTGSNYPTTGDFYGGRLWLGGCPDEGDWGTFWGSQPNDYFEFDLGTGADGDAIEFPIAKNGRIVWIDGGRNLMLGTVNTEYVVLPTTGAITQGNISVELQSTYGSGHVGALRVNSELFFVSGDFRTLRSLYWQMSESGWVSTDATFTAEHMTYEGISKVAFTRNPYSSLWLLLKDGSIASCVHRREDGEKATEGWYKVESDILYFRDIAVQQDEDGKSVLIAVASSKTDGDDQYFEMVLTPSNYQDSEEIFLDNYSVYDGVATDTPNFLGVLFEGDLGVVADGFHVVDFEFDEVTGDLELPREAERVIVGSPYEMTVETLPFILGEGPVSPVSYQMKRWVKVFLKMVASYMPTVNGIRPDERQAATAYDTAESFSDQFVQVDIGKGSDREGTITITQDLPFRFILTGIYGVVDVSDY